METINLSITVDEANAILAALGQQPYIQVADLIHKIQTQASTQLNGTSAVEASNGPQNGVGKLIPENHAN